VDREGYTCVCYFKYLGICCRPLCYVLSHKSRFISFIYSCKWLRNVTIVSVHTNYIQMYLIEMLIVDVKHE